MPVKIFFCFSRGLFLSNFSLFFFFNDTATTEIYTLSLHDALPIAALVMDAMVERVARELGLDPIEVRRRNLVTADMYPYTAPTGLFFEKLSHEASLDAVLALADYPTLCAERDRLRASGVYRGLGLCVFLDLTVPGAHIYGTGGARISSQDGTTIRLEPSGKLTVMASITEQGQGTDTILAQIAATAVGAPIEDVRVGT